jgi:hypothetical protein
MADFACEAAIDNKHIDKSQNQRRDKPCESDLERMRRSGGVVYGPTEDGLRVEGST